MLQPLVGHPDTVVFGMSGSFVQFRALTGQSDTPDTSPGVAVSGASSLALAGRGASQSTGKTISVCSRMSGRWFGGA